MTCARVIPFMRLPRTMHAFNYAVSEELIGTCLPGAFVVIPFRNRRIPGLVLSVSDSVPERLKLIIRALPLSYPSWNAQKNYLEWFARHYCISQATALKTLVPIFPASFISHPSPHEPFLTLAEVSATALFETSPTLFVNATLQERYAQEIALMQDVLKRKKSVIIFFPTIHDIRLFEPYARKAIGDDAVTSVHSGLSATVLFSRWSVLFDNAPRCILATRSGIGVPVHSIGAIIIDSSERIEHNQYDMNPRYDSRDCAWKMAECCNARLVSISAVPRLEDCITYSWIPAEHTVERLTKRVDVVNMHNELRAQVGPAPGYISEPLIAHITATLEKKKGVFLFLNRTGTSRMLACSDCGAVFSCGACKEPQNVKASSLICVHCNIQSPLPNRCQSCRSVRFKFIALGTEKIAELMKQRFSHSRVIEITQKHVIHELPKDIHGTIIVGTSFLPYAFPETFCDIELIGALSADPIISPNDFRAEERHWQTLFHLRMLAQSNGAQFMLQTFNPEHLGIQALIAGNYLRYAEICLEDRKKHGWPPAARLIRLRRPSLRSGTASAQHVRPKLAQPGAGSISRLPAESSAEARSESAPAHVLPPSLLTKLGLTIRSKNNHEILLSFNQQSLPKNELPESLQSFLINLPHDWLIDIDPVVL